jgi:YegS/Rv2252/BmrU family lipid kinase
MTLVDQDWVVILNPFAGKKKAGKHKDEIFTLLNKYKISFKPFITEYVGHAIELTSKLIAEGHRKFIGIGGDGTMNEIVNGIFQQKTVNTKDITMAFIPVGSGNDWVRTVGIPHDYEGAIKTIKTGSFFLHDVGKVIYQKDDKRNERYFANIAGIAYDAFVVQRVNKKKSGNYKMTVFTSLLKYTPQPLKLILDGKEVLNEIVFSGAIGHGRFNGKAMMQLPDAMPDDGIFDLTIYRNCSKMQVVKNTNKLYDGSFVKLPFISQYAATKVRIEAEIPVYVETDGEELGHSPIDIEMLTRSLKIISGIKNRVV